MESELSKTFTKVRSAYILGLSSRLNPLVIGDQAEIAFTLIGEPPFTFTYQRTELSPKKGAQGKVLETHTVSGVTANQYSIFSALEGEVSDFCEDFAYSSHIHAIQEHGPLLLSRIDTADILPHSQT